MLQCDAAVLQKPDMNSKPWPGLQARGAPAHMTLEEMTAQREMLLAARFRGVRTVEIDGRRVTYATDAEMAAAITDLERRMACAAEGGHHRRRLLTSASKGL